ncbi:MAG: Thrombospondin type 3 repeat protein [Myxococcales bacterium]|nr:Thrombospondin type 3 repeat protein [Myxococcales bacterium]
MLAIGLLALVISPVTASAQTAPPYDPAIDVQLFDYSVGPKTFFTVSDADIADKKQLAVDAVITFLTNPFTVYTVVGDTHNMIQTAPVRDRVVESMAAAQVTAAYGVNEKLQIGINLPIVFSLSGQGLDPAKGMADPNGLQVTGLGDVLAEGKYVLLRKNALRISGIAGVTLPTSIGSDGSKFIGDDLPTLRGKLALQWNSGPFAIGVNGGFILRKPRTIYSSTVGQQLTWAVGASYAITPRFAVIGEGFGRTGFGKFSLDESPIEVVGGLRLHVGGSVAVVVGGGAGLDKAIGAPDKMFFASIGYAPDVGDTDGDGIPNAKDRCPLIPEDKDGFQDEDGCPDDDNDGDRRPDSEDKCPNVAEDLDGFEDDDGCPEFDNDKDGILDTQDRCPNDPEDGKEPFPKDGCPADKRDSDGDGIPDSVDACPKEEEDADGFEDADGCPELDNDHDGIPDAQDKCPVCPEDKDGFQDDDGCPELDNDHDGIPDAQDKCPNEPETVNGIKDDDGCPDAGTETVALDGDRLTVAKVPTSAGDPIVDQMFLVMAGHDEVTKWLIAIASPNKASAQRLGDAIKARLEKRGIKAVEVLAATGPSKIGALVQERADADSTPVCPAGLEAKPRPELSVPSKSAAAAAAAAPIVTPTTTLATPPAPTPVATPAPADQMADPKPAEKPAAKPAAKKPAAKPAAKKPAAKKPDAGKKPDDDVEIEMGN